MNSTLPDDKLRLALIEETAHIGVVDRVSGQVRVRTVTEVEDTLVEQALQQTSVDVERVLVGRWIGEGDTLPTVRTEGDVTIIPVMEEVLVVERRLHLREEIRITRHASTKTERLPVALRKQHAIIERAGPDGVFQPDTPAPTPAPKD